MSMLAAAAPSAAVSGATSPVSKGSSAGGGLIAEQPVLFRQQPPATGTQECTAGGRGGHQQQQQHGVDVLATVPAAPGGRRGSMPLNIEAGGNGGAANLRADDKAWLLNGWGRAPGNANIPREREFIPSTTSFP